MVAATAPNFPAGIWADEAMNRLGFLLRRAAPFKREIALIAALTLLASLATLAIPFLLARLLGELADPGTISLPQVALWLLGALAAMTALNIASAMIAARTSLRVLTRLRTDMQSHLQSLPVSFHETSRKGDLLALISYEVSLLGGFFTGALANFPANIFTAIGAVILLFAIDPIMALFVPAIAVILIAARKLLGRRLWELSKQSQAADAALIWESERSLELAPAIKSFAAEEAFAAHYRRAAHRSQTLNFAEQRLSAWIAPLIAFAGGAVVLALFVWGGERITGAGRDPAEVFAFILYAALLTRPMGSLAGSYADYKKAQGALTRMDSVLAMQSEHGLQQSGQIDLKTSAITFADISFSYPGRGPTLRDVTFTIAPGETIALVGENGAGKSTIVRLLMRFYDPDEGEIRIGEQALESLNIQGLRAQIGYVPQRALLFDGTIAENISFGRDSTDAAAIEAVAKLAQAWDFISALPDGLDTAIGDDGVRLSGGQRQRIALARALFADPPMLILDEATSMYDAASEAAFVEGCADAMDGRTVIIITHREGSLALADRVLHVADGRLTEH